VPWIVPSQYATITNHTQETRVTILENGLRIATEQKFGHFCTVGGIFLFQFKPVFNAWQSAVMVLQWVSSFFYLFVEVVEVQKLTLKNKIK